MLIWIRMVYSPQILKIVFSVVCVCWLNFRFLTWWTEISFHAVLTANTNTQYYKLNFRFLTWWVQREISFYTVLTANTNTQNDNTQQQYCLNSIIYQILVYRFLIYELNEQFPEKCTVFFSWPLSEDNDDGWTTHPSHLLKYCGGKSNK